MSWLAALFLFVALVYSMAGFGGGSSYTAFLALSGAPYQVIPIVSLTCNLMVVSAGSFQYLRAGHLNCRLLLPFLVTSIPAALWAGSIVAERRTFLIVLASCLLAAGTVLLSRRDSGNGRRDVTLPSSIWLWGPLMGLELGGVSGFVGIGGGIFLAPLLHLLRWGNPKQVAASASLFIWVNSAAGLAGQLVKKPDLEMVAGYWMLPLVVLIGGMVGGYLGSRKISQVTVTRVTAVLVLYVSIRLWLMII